MVRALGTGAVGSGGVFGAEDHDDRSAAGNMGERSEEVAIGEDGADQCAGGSRGRGHETVDEGVRLGRRGGQRFMREGEG